MKRISRNLRYQTFWSLMVLLLAVVGNAEAKLKVVATLPSLADIARNVGGEDVEVVSLTKGNQDPHFVDAKPDLVLQLNRADLLIRVGLGVEDGWLPPLQVNSRNGRIQTGGEGNLEASQAVELKDVPKSAVDRSQGDVHPGGNPHFMLDPHNGVKVARAIEARLAKLDATKAADFKKRGDAYVKDLEQRIKSWEAALKPLKGRAVVPYHKSWVYFEEWIGLQEAGTVEPKPGIPPSPEHVVKLIRTMRDKKVNLMLIEPYYPKSTAEHVAQETKAKLVTLPTEPFGAPGAADEAKSYFGVFDAIVARLKGV